MTISIRQGILGAATLAGLALSSAGAVSAATVGVGNLTVASGGDVTAYFMASSAGYTSDLYLVGYSGPIFNNQTTQDGTSVNLGSFAAGTVLSFYITVENTGTTFYTGSGSNNPDGLAHAAVSFDSGTGLTNVGFEDLLGGGDQDYDDLTFALSNVTSVSAVPLPATAWLLMGAFGASALLRRRREAPLAV